MPSKNTIKKYLDNSFYHVYNRGVEQRAIFLDDQDFRVLLFYFKIYLTSPSELKKLIVDRALVNKFNRIESITRAMENNFYGRIQLHCYTLMPNHFHLTLWQQNKDDLANLIKSVFTKYSMYFNNRYKRIGKLFQGTYKAKIITEDNYFMHLTRYIHLNPVKLDPQSYPKYEKWTSAYDYPYSSCRYYLDSESSAPTWLTQTKINEYFPNKERYLKYLKEFNSKSILYLGDGLLEKGDSLEGDSL